MIVRVLGAVLAALLLVSPVSAAERTYTETGQTVRGAFLDFYDANGGLDVFGYPRTGEVTLNGHTVQWFQRARFEWWPENPPGFQVQLGLLAQELGRGQGPSLQSSDPNRHYFPETQHSIGGAFRDFWETRGGLTLFGYPISDELTENGLTVQYFQRARFEFHPENPPAYRVQLGLLGDELLGLRAAASVGSGKLLVSTGVGGDFYLMDPNGANAVKLGRGTDPVLSPDGTKLAFAREDGLWVQSASGGEPTRIYDGDSVRGPVFSPDGSQIAFFETYTCIRKINRRENKFVDCHRIKVVPTAGGTDWLPAGQSPYATSPTWSPDGTRIAFKDEKSIFVVSHEKDAKQLSEFQPLYWQPVWSPAGGRIAVERELNHDHYILGTIPDDGSVGFVALAQSPPFANPAQNNLSPAWSPDGTKIAFASDRDGALKIWVMNADGTGAVKVSDIPLHFQNVFERFVSWGGR